MFFRTNKSNGHYHILASVNGEMIITPGASSGDPHPHEIDPTTGRWIGEDHEHYLLEPLEPGLETFQDKEKVEEILETFMNTYEFNREFNTRALRNVDFYKGNQWSSAAATKLEKEERAVLTVNVVEAYCDLLEGHILQNPVDYRVVGISEEDQFAAEVYNKTLKHVQERNDFNALRAKMFREMLVSGLGAYYNYEKNKEIVIEVFPYYGITLPPHEKEDLSDVEYFFLHTWIDKRKAKGKWPDKASKIGESEKIEDEFNPNIYGWLIENVLDKHKKNVRLIYYFIREIDTREVLYSPEDDLYINTKGWNKKDVELAATIPGFQKTKREYEVIRKVTIAGNVIVEDDTIVTSVLPATTAYAKKYGYEVWSKVDLWRGSQEEINKRRSHMIDILNKMAIYGWFFEDGAFDTPTDQSDFELNANSPGKLFKLASGGLSKIKPIEGTKWPSEIANLEELTVQRMREIGNVNLSFQGAGQNIESGIAIAEKKNQALMGNQYLFENLTRSDKQLMKKIIMEIPNVYSPEQIVKIMGKLPEGLTVDDVAAVLKQKDVTKFDVQVQTATYAPTYRNAMALFFLNLQRNGGNVPMEMVIKYLDIPVEDKQELEGYLNAQREIEQQKEQNKLKQTIVPALIKEQGGNTGGQPVPTQ